MNKPVDITIPFDPQTIPQVVQVFPQITRVGIWEESISPPQLEKLLINYPDLRIVILSVNPQATARDLVNDRISFQLV